jgi:hypothetical protein
LKGIVGDILRGDYAWIGTIGVKRRGVLNTEFAEDTQSQRRGGELRMWIGKHGRG